MGTFETLKSIWKSLGVKGHVINFSSAPLWVLETDSGKPVAHLLLPRHKSPPTVDCDAFRRKDGLPIDGHSSWWKFYDFSTAEVFDAKGGLRVSIIKRLAVTDREFTNREIIYDDSKKWGLPIQLLTDVKRDKKKRIIGYFVTGSGWIGKDQILAMACNGLVDNARPVFPAGGQPYVRTRRDLEMFNNIDVKG